MAEPKMQLVDWLDDLCVRFIVNLPREELESVERICFQVEEAQWFYEDFIRPLDPTLPSLALRQFSLKIFQHCPLFAGYDTDVFSAAYANFLVYKGQIPVRGAILLNEALDEVVLVKGWKKSASWSFPRGKINKDESDIDCAIREVYEETGYDIKAAGLVGSEDESRSIEITMRDQNLKLFIFPGIPMDTHFEPRTRKEISKIQWYKLSSLPALKKHKGHQNEEQELSSNASKFYMVAPFMGPLKRHISQLKKLAKSKSVSATALPQVQIEPMPATEIHVPQVDDMSRLMAQLRQSQQASRENNLPEVTKIEAVQEDCPSHLTNPLNQLVVAISPMARAQDNPEVRESKAQTMLNLLRGPAPQPRRERVELPPETPFDQITTDPLQPPPSPKQHPHRLARVPMAPAPAIQFGPLGPFLPPVQPFHVGQPQIPGPLLRHHQSQHNPVGPQHLHNGFQSLLQPQNGQYQDNSFLQNDRQAMATPAPAPAADKLPMPKLSAHSSKLLDLFKQGSNTPQLSHLAVDSPRLELAASKPVTGGTARFLFQRPPPADGMRASHALASSSTEPLLRSGQKPPSQQEMLLDLFKGSVLPGKSSSSLASQSAPVELSANPDSARIDTYNASIEQSPREARASVRNISPLTEDERPFKLPLNEAPELSPDLSATVTGPLGEVQFDMLRSVEQQRRSHLTQSPKQPSPKRVLRRNEKAVPQQQIRILSRPSSAHAKASAQEKVLPPRASPTRLMPEQQKAMPAFQPQILKRSAIPAIQHEDLLIPTPQIFPQILSRSTNIEKPQQAEPSKAATDNQKAKLLALFGAKQVDDSPVMSASALPVSPVSERPPPDSALPSPIGTNSRSRMTSLQGDTGFMAGIPNSGSGSIAGSGQSTPKPGLQGKLPLLQPAISIKAGPSSAASPVNRDFLLGFLDGVAKESTR